MCRYIMTLFNYDPLARSAASAPRKPGGPIAVRNPGRLDTKSQFQITVRKGNVVNKPSVMMLTTLGILFGLGPGMMAGEKSDLDAWVGRPVDIAASAYQYRADRPAEQNPPESWILFMQHADLEFNKPIDMNNPAIKKVLCGLLWEEIRPVRRVDLSWSPNAKGRPSPDEVVLSYFDGDDEKAHQWWNPSRTIKEAGKPEVSADGRTFTYAISADTWGVVAALRGEKDAAAFSVPDVRAYVTDVWKKAEIDIEWGFEESTAKSEYDGRLETYDAIVGDLRPLAGDSGTVMTGSKAWESHKGSGGRRGIRATVLYMGAYHPRPGWAWPPKCPPEDISRSIVTVWTKSGSFSFLASDLEKGPILAPEYGFYVADPKQGKTAKEFRTELSAKGRKTIRQRVREHSEPTWEGTMAAIHGEATLPPIPKSEIEPAMQVEVPDERLSAQWKLATWHILRRSVQDKNGKWHFNCYPYGVLAQETYHLLHALDFQGRHKEAADGLDQWLLLPLDIKIVPGPKGVSEGPVYGGQCEWALPDRPVGHFSDGRGSFTNAEGPPGVSGSMDGPHATGPGAIMFAMSEHFRLTGDMDWLRTNAPRMKANAEWMLRQRELVATILPGGDRLWSRGLQPAITISPDISFGGLYAQYFNTDAFYWLAVKRMADLLSLIDPQEGAKMAAAAKAYRHDAVAALERSITLSPVTEVRDGTYHSFIPAGPYVRGFTSGPWGWKRSRTLEGTTLDIPFTGQVVTAGLLEATDPRVQGFLDVLEDRLLLEVREVRARTKQARSNPRLAAYDPEKDWFSLGGFAYSLAYESQANIHLQGDDVPLFLRTFYNSMAAAVDPDAGYIFWECPFRFAAKDKIVEEGGFLERFRLMLLMEDGESLWLARATPRAWLEQGKKISVKNAPSVFGTVAYEIVSDIDHGKITATVEMPSRGRPQAILLRLRHPQAAPIKSVTVDGKSWPNFKPDKETIDLKGLKGKVIVVANY
jgi:hypothetical protein